VIDGDLDPSAQSAFTEVKADLGYVGRFRGWLSKWVLLVGLLLMPPALREQSIEVAESGEVDHEHDGPTTFGDSKER